MDIHEKCDCSYCNKKIKKIRELGEDDLWNPYVAFLKKDYAPNHSPIEDKKAYLDVISKFMKLKQELNESKNPGKIKKLCSMLESEWVSDNYNEKSLMLNGVHAFYNVLEDVIDDSLPLNTRNKRMFLERIGMLVLGVYSKEDNLSLGHSADYIKDLEKRAESKESFDEETPLNKDILKAARNGVNTAISALRDLNNSRMTLAITGTPGHHCAYDKNYGGLCYYNNAAITANYLNHMGIRTAILDVDSHFANGTANIAEKSRKWSLVDLHEQVWASPFSEGDSTGEKSDRFCKNYSLNIGANTQIYTPKLKQAMEQIYFERPKVLITCLGVDSHVKDPFGLLALDTEAFKQIGSEIGEFLMQTNSKCIFLTEGGYGKMSPYLIASTISEANKKIYKP